MPLHFPQPCPRPLVKAPFAGGLTSPLHGRLSAAPSSVQGGRMKILIASFYALSLAMSLTSALPARGGGKRKTEKAKAAKAKSGEVSTYEDLILENYDLNLDNYGEVIDLSNYEDLYDYGDPGSKIEVGTLASPSKKQESTTRFAPTSRPSMPKAPLATSINREELDLFGGMTEQGLPTCLVCVCLGTSVYCDDADLLSIPKLPRETTYLYARFNQITRIRADDFTGLKKLKLVDLSSNSITEIDEDAFRLLPALQELIVSENQLRALPELPSSMTRIDARLNKLQSSGIKHEAFKDLKKLHFLYLSDNKLDHIPMPFPESLRSLHLQNNNIQSLHVDAFCDSRDLSHIRRSLEDIRLDGNPINLSTFSNAYFCLPRLPTGRYY
ncbi:opticin [Ambystoma mexicanum]|uniref:opticin n=1 Tax=Ambystoma mexicanum TaxID=8296 RepID=UPI0037E79464